MNELDRAAASHPTDEQTKALQTERQKTDMASKCPTYSLDEQWVQDYIRDFGSEPSFF